MKRAEGKAVRINQIEMLLWSHPEGLTRTEVARRIGVHRSVITKYVDQDDLPPSIYEDFLDGKKLKIDRAADLTKASFTLHEVMAIHLATRLLATRTDKQNPMRPRRCANWEWRCGGWTKTSVVICCGPRM